MTASPSSTGVGRPSRPGLVESFRALPETLRLFLRMGRIAWRAAPGVLSLLVVVHVSLAAVPVAQIWLFKLLVDTLAQTGTPTAPRDEYWLAAALYGVTLFLAQAAAVLLGPLDDTLNERLQGVMRGRLLEIGERQPGLAFYEDEQVQNDIESARRGLDYVLLEAMSLMPLTLQNLVIVVSLSALLARLHPLLPLLLIGSAVPQFQYESRLRDTIWTGMTGRSPHWRWLNYCARVIYGAEFAKEVRLFGLGDFFLGRHRETFERAHAELVELRRREQLGKTLYGLLNAGVTGGAYVVIVLTASQGRVSLGDVALFTGATFQLSGALKSLIQFHGSLAEHRLRLRTFYSLFDRAPTIDVRATSGVQVFGCSDGSVGSVGSDRIGRAVGPEDLNTRIPDPTPLSVPHPPRIELRDVWFSYPGKAAPAVCGVSLCIEPGEKIALVGENGAGKTTLLSLITRLYDPTRGEVLADRTPLRALDVRQWRRRLSNVSQDFLRLEAPLRTNLALAALGREMDDDALRAACEQAGLGDLLRTLTGGLDQVLGKRFQGGTELSGGEWQKVAIARALLRAEAGVIILDEPTSALDAPTEHAIFRQFVQLAEQRTTILVSHRFSTVHMADRIVVLEAGAIAEDGTHSELMARRGKYAELFELQAARYR